ncbi:MAG TPA: site-2 protease family protein [Candidatus Nanoarchaeia archaeon]|nr:site-2 protease family protein [Candidatus Nanoarchaeia archaeon]
MSFFSDPFTRIDLIFLAAFLIFFSSFLYTRKKNLRREGLLFLYKTKWGIRLINYLGTRYKKTIGVLSYISVFTGYVLMAGVLYLIYTILKIYLFSPEIVRAIKVPPLIPLVPYLPQVFKLGFLPPFYFTYWIIILAIIAIAHEAAHGIFAVHSKVKIKTTGFGFFPYFLPIFLAAFVELDEKKMAKKKKFPQLAILSAGTFANIITGILFLLILFGFFSVAFSPSGVVFDTYATSTITIAGVSMVNGVPLINPTYEKILNLSEEDGFNEINFNSETYLVTKEVLENQADNEGSIFVYSDAPAIRANLSSIITEINGVKIDSIDKLVEEISKYSPGDKITITEKTDEGFSEKELVLEEHPERPGNAWLGIGFFDKEPKGFFGRLVSNLASFRDQNVYYEPKIDGISVFIYNLLWWVVIISISVALINMLPVGIFDGGRFFYLTVLGITKSENIAKRAFAFSTYLFLFILLILMVTWLSSILGIDILNVFR